MKLKKEELKEQKPKPKQLNEMTEENIMQTFGISEDQLNKATSILERSESTKNSEYSSACLVKDNVNKEVSEDTVNKEVFVINTGKTKGTTFKIKIKDLAFFIIIRYWCTSKLH